MSDHPELPRPKEIIVHLDLFVRGQARAKQDIAVAVCNHYLSQAWREREGEDLGRHHILRNSPPSVVYYQKHPRPRFTPSSTQREESHELVGGPVGMELPLPEKVATLHGSW